MTQYFANHGVANRADAAHRALVAIGHVVQKQTFILAICNTFYLVGAVPIVALLAALPLEKPDHPASGGGLQSPTEEGEQP